MKYRKKPVVIEAFVTEEPMDIETLEGVMHASAGDYIITGVEGERYPCKPDIFARTYEPVDSGPASPDRDALLALADNLDSSASMLLKQNDLDPNRKRRGMRRDHAQSLMAASGRIREALGWSNDTRAVHGEAGRDRLRVHGGDSGARERG